MNAWVWLTWMGGCVVAPQMAATSLLVHALPLFAPKSSDQVALLQEAFRTAIVAPGTPVAAAYMGLVAALLHR